MSAKTKIIIAVVLLSFISLGVGMYFAWEQNTDPLPNVDTPINLGLGNQINNGSVSKMEILGSNKAAAYWVAGEDTSNGIFYISDEGDVYNLKNGKEEKILNQVAQNIKLIKKSSDGQNVLIESFKNNIKSFVGFDAKDTLSYPALMGIEDIAWAPGGDNIALLQKINNSLQIGTAGIKYAISGEGYKKLISLNQLDYNIQWPRESMILLVPKPSNEIISEIWQYDIKSGKLAKFLSDKGLMISWSKFGDVALKFFIDEGGNNKFVLADGNGANVANFGFVTFPDKCFISTPRQLYCAVPLDQKSIDSMVLPDDYLMRKAYFKDGLYQINLDDQKITSLYEGSDPVIDAVNISVIRDKLFFINRYDSRLYQLSL